MTEGEDGGGRRVAGRSMWLTSLRHAWSGALVATLAVGLVAGTLRLPASAQGSSSAAVGDPVVAAKVAFEAAVAHREQTAAELARIDAELATLAGERMSLDGDQRAVAEALSLARDEVRDVALEAYIGGRPMDMTTALLFSEDADDLAFRTELLAGHLESRRAAVEEYRSLRDEAGTEVTVLVDRLDALEDDRDATAAALDAAIAAEREAERQYSLLLERQRRESLPPGVWGSRGRFVPAGSDGSPTPEQSGNAAGLAWDLLRWCESGGNYASISATGRFRGAYMFHIDTWPMLGGVGDPTLATTAEQDYRAQLLYDMLGSKPWPVCGRYLDMTPEELAAVASGQPLPGPPPPTVPDPDPAAPTPVPSSVWRSSTTTVPSSTTSTSTSSTTSSTSVPDTSSTTTPAP